MTGEVPECASDAASQTHDIITQSVPVSSHHAIEHEVEVPHRGSVADGEQPTLAADGAIWLRVPDHFERLGLSRGGRANHTGDMRRRTLPGLLDTVRLATTNPALKGAIWRGRIEVQWNLSNTDTLGPIKYVLIREVSSFQGANNTLELVKCPD